MSDNRIIFFRAGSPILGYTAKEIIIIDNHPALDSIQAQEWLRHVVYTKVELGGQIRKVWH